MTHAEMEREIQDLWKVIQNLQDRLSLDSDQIEALIERSKSHDSQIGTLEQRVDELE